MHVLIAGMGDLGMRIARIHRDNHDSVWGLRRTIQEDSEFPLIAADLTAAEPLSLPRSEWNIVYFCPAGGRGADYHQLYHHGLRKVIHQLGPGPTTLVFVSSTSVYPYSDGRWVDEDSPVFAAEARPEGLIRGEQLALNTGGIVLRLGGIYGPGRDSLIRAARENRADQSVETWTNRIHVCDAARAAVFLALRGIPGTYNGVDDFPVLRSEVVHYLSNSMQPLMASQTPATGKRVSNRKLRELGFEFKYPDYRSGYTNGMTDESC